MSSIVRRFLAVCTITVFVAVALGASAAAEVRPVRKIDNFIIFPDQSGSMYLHLATMKKANISKMGLAKRLLVKMNTLIPELGYEGSIYLFAPFQEVQAPAVYDPRRFAEGIEKIPGEQPVFGRLTPMSPGIKALDPVLAGMKGRTAVILISDGKPSFGGDPLSELAAMRLKYPQVCFHVISFAHDAKGRATLEAMARRGGCVFAGGLTLLNVPYALCKFVRNVFYDEVEEPARKDEVIVLRGIRFDFDKSDIKPEWTPVLDEGAAMLKSKPDAHVTIEGHTDSVGSDEYNRKLSLRRADAVYRYFVAKGIPSNRMTVMGFGESRPMATNGTAEGRAINRRVEIRSSGR